MLAADWGTGQVFWSMLWFFLWVIWIWLLVLVFGDIFNILIVPYEKAAGPLREIKLIYTAPQEFFFTQMKLALFGALFIAVPIIANQIYKFVAPGLYRNERQAFLPFLVATPILFRDRRPSQRQ